MLPDAKILLLCYRLTTFQNFRMSAKLSGAQNVERECERKILQKLSTSANFLTERERSTIF